MAMTSITDTEAQITENSKVSLKVIVTIGGAVIAAVVMLYSTASRVDGVDKHVNTLDAHVSTLDERVNRIEYDTDRHIQQMNRETNERLERVIELLKERRQ